MAKDTAATPGRDDISFGFNPAPFVNGMDKINHSIAGTNKNTENLAKKISQGMMSAATKIAAVGAGFLGVKAIVDKIPEVGMVFKIAGDIFWKNLLWPLRKELMPLLQWVLNWTRDNRGQFVVWGQTLANVFRTIVVIVKEIMNVAKGVGGAFLLFINSVFGSQIRNFNELLNVLTFKFSLVAQFIGGILTKILSNPFFVDMIKFLGSIVGLMAGIGTDVLGPILEGLMGSGLQDAATPLKAIADAIEGLLRQIKAFTGTPEVKGFLKFIGEIFGSSIQLVLLNLASVFEAVTDSIQWLIFGIQALIEVSKNTPWEDIGKMATDLAAAQGGRWSKIGAGYERLGADVMETMGIGTKAAGTLPANNAKIPYQVKDALITKRGDVVKFDPDDNIFASKGGSGKGVSVQFGEIHLTVTEGSAKMAGVNFANSIYEQIRTKLNLEFTGEGL